MEVLECSLNQWVSAPPRRTRSSPRWIALAAAFAAALLVWRALPRPPRLWSAPVVSAADFVSGIPGIQQDLKLVVARLDLNKTALAENQKVLLGVDLGTTRVSLSVPARIHYAIDLAGTKPVDFRLRADRRELTAIFRDPGVQAVEILTSGQR